MFGSVRFVLSLLFFTGLPAIASASDSRPCTNSTLKGTYIFSASGFDSNETKNYVAYTGMLYYDGKSNSVALAPGYGKVKYLYKYAGDGDPFSINKDPLNPLLEGKYIVRPNCKVEVTYKTTPPRTALYFLAPSGDNFSYAITSGSLISSVVVRISRDDLVSIPEGPSLGFFSDIRLKKDIELIGRSQNGHNLYRYRYLWSDQVYVGVMAQEVKTSMPEAVVKGKDGLLRVYYDKLGLKLQTWEEYKK